MRRAPSDYLVAYFDHFAEGFDKQLIEVLGYRVPEELVKLLASTARTWTRAIDIGCGTGLAGPLLRGGCQHLVGIDLSPRMLQKAAGRKTYDALVEADILAWLSETRERFDLVFAAEDAQLGMPEILRGSFGQLVTSTLLHGGVPIKKLSYIALVGRNLSGVEADQHQRILVGCRRSGKRRFFKGR